MAVIDVVKYSGPMDNYAWKFPREDLATFTQLIVNESQEAVLFKGGQALDVFGPGRHTLETANIPLLNKIINIPFGSRSPFSCEVWFVNKAVTLDVKWGTPSPIQIQDPRYKVFIPIRSYGQFGIQIADSRKFLTKLVGTMPVYDRDNLTGYFKGIYITKIKDSISAYLVKKQITLLELNAYISEISDFINKRIAPDFAEFGIDVMHFAIKDISAPEDDPAVKKLKEALAKKAEMDIIGYDYRQQRSFDALQDAASNPSGGQAGMMGAGIGLGMGVGVGGAFGTAMGDLGNLVSTKRSVDCPKCGTLNPAGTKFCGDCGTKLGQSTESKNMILCSNCGKEFPETAKFCPECGDKYNRCPECGTDLKDTNTPCLYCGYTPPTPCPKCGAKTNDGKVKYCPECGTPFVKKCAKCNAELAPETKFCPECGAENK